MARYMVPGVLQPPPQECDWTKAVTTEWGELLNDSIGCCVIAAAGHQEMVWTYNTGKPYKPSDHSIMLAYEDVGGYSPLKPSTDQGCDPNTALKYWRDTGISGHKIAAWVEINASNKEELQQSIYLFGGAFLAFSLPAAAQKLKTWDIPEGQALTGDWGVGSWGGHEVLGVRYDANGVYVVSWGEIYLVTWSFLAKFCDEPYCVLSNDWLTDQGKSPLGFDIDVLKSDLEMVSAKPVFIDFGV